MNFSFDFKVEFHHSQIICIKNYFLAKISSEKDLERLKNFFLQLDVDNSGTLTVDEIEKAVKEESSLTSKTMSGILWKFLERFCAQGVSFIVSIVLARLLLPEDFGNVAMILIFITIADVFVNSGFATALIQKKDADDLDYSTMFYSSQFTSILIYIAIFFLAPLVGKFYNNDFLVLLLRVFALRIPLSVFNSIQHAYVSNKMLKRKIF